METLEQAQVKLSDNGRIVIPAALRQAMGFQAGDDLILIAEEDGLRITTVRKRAEWAQRLVKQYDNGTGSMVDELITDRRREAMRELSE